MHNIPIEVQVALLLTTYVAVMLICFIVTVATAVSLGKQVYRRLRKRRKSWKPFYTYYPWHQRR